MHINNVSAKTSIKFILIFTLFAGLYTAGTILAYVYLSGYAEKSISGFFSWALASLNSQEHIEDALLLIALPVIFYTGLIITVVQRYLGLKKLASSLNLKSVDLLPDRVKFNFNRPQYNFACGYGDIKNLEMVLHTVVGHNKYGSYIVLNEIELNFTVLKDKKLSLKNTPLKTVNFIYKIIDYSRMVNNFSYKFNGAGVHIELKEKIDDYLQKGVKPVLTNTEETKFKWMSIVFFLMGFCLFIGLKDELNYCIQEGLWFPFIFPAIFIGISFIVDLILIIDKIKEKSFRGYNGR